MDHVLVRPSFLRLHLRVAVVIACAVLAACGGGDSVEAVPPQASFVRLGQIPGYASTSAIAVSNDGRVVAGTAGFAARAGQAFRWTAESGLVALGFMPGGTYSHADAISADGSTVLSTGDTSVPPSPYSALFLWRAGSPPALLQSPSIGSACTGSGISGDGTVVAGTCLGPGPNMAYRWTGSAAPVGLGRYGGGTSAYSNATGISKDGSTIVGHGHPFLAGAIFWKETATILGKLPGDTKGYGSGVSRDGTVVVGFSIDGNDVSRGFRWTSADGMASLGAAPSGVIGTYASAVSGDGRRVVGWGTTAAADTALLWDSANGWRVLAAALREDFGSDVPGWALNRATAISDDGSTIVGYGTNPSGQTEAWLVRLPN